MAAPTNYAKHIEEMQKFRDTIPGLARFSPDIEKAGIFLKSNSSLVGPSEGIPMRFPDRRNDHEAELVRRSSASRAAISRRRRPRTTSRAIRSAST